MKYTNLFMVRGDTFGFDITIEGLTNDLSNAYFSVRESYTETPVAYVFQKTLGNGITKVDNDDTSLRQYHIELANADTQNVELGNYYYDLQLENGDEVFTPLIGMLQISYDVTREYPNE